MSTEVAPAQAGTEANPTTPKAKQGKSPAKGAVTSAVVQQLHADEQTIAAQAAQIVVLSNRVEQLEAANKAGSAAPVDKRPVTQAQLMEAIAKLAHLNAASLKGDSPRVNLSLASVLGFVPNMTPDQKKEWAPHRDKMAKAHSNRWKELSGEAIGHLKRAAKNKDALMGGRFTRRKSDNALTGVSLRATRLAKPIERVKGKGKGAAKPSQVAGKMPVAGNAANPAKLS